MFLPVYGPLELLAHNTVPQTGPPQGPSDSACVCLSAGSTRSIRELLKWHSCTYTPTQPPDAQTHTDAHVHICARKHGNAACERNTQLRTTRSHKACVCMQECIHWLASHIKTWISHQRQSCLHRHTVRTYTHSLKAPT